MGRTLAPPFETRRRSSEASFWPCRGPSPILDRHVPNADRPISRRRLLNWSKSHHDGLPNQQLSPSHTRPRPGRLTTFWQRRVLIQPSHPYDTLGRLTLCLQRGLLVPATLAWPVRPIDPAICACIPTSGPQTSPLYLSIHGDSCCCCDNQGPIARFPGIRWLSQRRMLRCIHRGDTRPRIKLVVWFQTREDWAKRSKLRRHSSTGDSHAPARISRTERTSLWSVVVGTVAPTKAGAQSN